MKKFKFYIGIPLTIILLLICLWKLSLCIFTLSTKYPTKFRSWIFFAFQKEDSNTTKLRKDEVSLLNYDRRIDQILWEIDKDKISILVEKSKYRLTVYYGDTAVKAYPVVFGFNPVDDKLREGDGCTPEGEFKISALYPHRSWRRFLLIDYPTDESWRKHLLAKREGRINQDASIGGEIGIHGVPEGCDDLIDRKINWTLGCISLKNRDIEELYQIVKIGTKVKIIH